jgi:hypothetical protein
MLQFTFTIGNMSWCLGRMILPELGSPFGRVTLKLTLNHWFQCIVSHQADSTRGICRQKAGRKAFLNKRFDDDRDDLFNCEGCTKAFHHFCGGLTQDSPEARRRHHLDPYRALTFARRVEPHLCEECRRNAGRRQLDYERKKYEDDRAKAMAKREAKRAQSNINARGWYNIEKVVSQHEVMILAILSLSVYNFSTIKNRHGWSVATEKKQNRYKKIIKVN